MQLKNKSEEIVNNVSKTKNTARNRRMLVWLVILALVAGAIAYLIKPRPIVVDLHTVQKGSLMVSIDEEGRTRVRDVYTLSAPVTGKLDRINLKVGDTVKANETPLITIHPQSPAYLDVRSEKQATAAIDTAKATRKFSLAELERVKSDLSFAKSEYERAQQLLQERVIPAQQLEDAEHVYKVAQAALSSARAAVQMRSFELEQAKAMLITPADGMIEGENCQCVPMTSAISGQILKVFDPSSRTVTTGEMLLEIGNASELEIVVDLLSADAVQVQVGNRVLINDWGGDSVLEGRVRRIEPFGFTKVSALGIEEQRVNVIIDLVSDQQSWKRLGHGYQVGLSIVLWQADEIISLPLTAIFRKSLSQDEANEDQWAVFAEEQGEVHVRDITLGKKSGLNAQVLIGLEIGERVVLHPSNKIKGGVAIVDRSDSF